ncbi:hypothetical protein ABFS82_09G031100 [Erythranthe guttata]|uniref:Uncharacterized protein n=1 Tax=Erythranthe guttata TaxID=4155 RepID=A0A022R7G6_ERYGU|nr:PREDICTED: serine/threonine-protein kinase fray2 [Erythranthe guttata]EYU35914.1 hypothetical protein MIMGU_mgv1a009508mg [Erythranthe guttata]|eukprot:XP_012839439.1 PREDICTED: serine/threonine-protein kinase fray2 [Erythranthe guttata]
MEDEKLAAYYDDLSRRGGGAARFKQGLGFSSSNSSANDAVPARGSALPTTSSLLSSFVRASRPSKTSEFEWQAQVQSIQNKLSKKPKGKTRSRSPSRNSSRQSPSRDTIRDKPSRRRSRSRDRRSRRRSRSRDYESRSKYRSRSRSRENNRKTIKRRESPEDRRRSEKGKKRVEVRSGSAIDFATSIEGYDNMTPAERVKAKMKLQLSKTAENDETIGKGSGWERFDFNKDAPLDDEEVEAVEDDGALVKRMGQSFRFSAVQARKEEEIRAAHDEAMFGGSSYPLPPQIDNEKEEEENHIVNESIETTSAVTSLLSDQVLAMQKKGSWRDRVRDIARKP